MHRCPCTEEGKILRAHLADGDRPSHTKMASLQPASSSILTTVGRRPTMLRENGNSVSNHVELSSSLRCQLIMHSVCDCRTAPPHNTQRQCRSQAHVAVKSVHGILAGAEEGLCQPRLVAGQPSTPCLPPQLCGYRLQNAAQTPRRTASQRCLQRCPGPSVQVFLQPDVRKNRAHGCSCSLNNCVLTHIPRVLCAPPINMTAGHDRQQSDCWYAQNVEERCDKHLTRKTWWEKVCKQILGWSWTMTTT